MDPHASRPPLISQHSTLGATKDCQLVIHIIHATDLAAVNRTISGKGLSDPFAVVKVTNSIGLNLEGKTPHLLDTLDPVWNETLTFEKVAAADTVVTISIRDWNQVGGSKSLGQVPPFKLSELALPEDGTPKLQASVRMFTPLHSLMRMHIYMHARACERMPDFTLCTCPCPCVRRIRTVHMPMPVRAPRCVSW